MNQSDIVAKLNKIYPNMQPLVECEDQFCSCDATNNRFIVEIKIRDKEYDSWIIERDKFNANVDKSVDERKQFIYLTEYNGKIMTWNINKLALAGYDFKWEKRPMPKTTEFDNTNQITKAVGYLYEKDAKIHKEKE